MQWMIILLTALLLVLCAIKLNLLRRARLRQETQAPPLQEVLPGGIVARPRMLFYFYSEHCGLCRSVTPLIEDLRSRADGVVKVDVRRHLMTARRFGISSTPSLVLVEQGRIAGIHVGAISAAMLQQFYEGQARDGIFLDTLRPPHNDRKHVAEYR